MANGSKACTLVKDEKIRTLRGVRICHSVEKFKEIFVTVVAAGRLLGDQRH